MTDGQLAHWRKLAVACDMPPLYVDRNTQEDVRAAFPHVVAALLAERERVRQLTAQLAYIDTHAPLADATCDEPGITLSEAAQRAMQEVQPRPTQSASATWRPGSPTTKRSAPRRRR